MSPVETLTHVLAMRDKCYASGSYGPFVLFYPWTVDKSMSDSYSGRTTLRNRLLAIEGINDVRLDENLDRETFVLKPLEKL